MTKTKTIIKDAAKFTIGGYISSVCNFASSVIVRRILDPFFMGVYTELLLIFDYAKYNHLGIIDSLDRQIPYYNGKKEFKKTETVKDAGASFSLIASFIVAAAITVISFVFQGRLSKPLSTGLMIIAIMIVVQTMSSFYITLARTHHQFGPLSKYIILVAVCDVGFKAALGIKFGMMGILWATVITLALGMIYLFNTSRISFVLTLKISGKTVMELLEIGFPLLLASFAFLTLRSVDRFMIISFLTKEDLGYYSIALMMHSFVFQFPNLIYVVLFPRFYEAFGNSENNLNNLRGYLERPTLIFAYLFPIIVGIAVILMPVFVRYVLPKYTQGITAAAILLFGTVFLSITYMSGYLLIALKKQRMLILISLLCTVISVITNLIFLNILHLGINGVAWASFLSYFFYSLFLIGYAASHYMKNARQIGVFLSHLYGPLLWTMVVYSGFKIIFHYSFNSFKSDIFNMALECGLFLVLTLPLLFYANKKVALIEILNYGRRR